MEVKIFHQLTLDVDPGGGVQPLSLAHGAVPDRAPVAGPVIFLQLDGG